MDDNNNNSDDPNKNKAFSYKKLYQNLFVDGSNLVKLEKEELQEYIYENYRDFIALQGEYDEFFKEFGDIKSKFSQFENSLKYIFENVNEVKERKLLQMKKKIQQQHSDTDSDDSDDDDKQAKNKQKNKKKSNQQDEDDDFSDDDEDNNYKQFQNQQRIKKEREEMAEQINEFLDNISINTFEKNYLQAITALEVLQNMKSSEKFFQYLNQFEIRRTLEQHYQTLVDSMVNDLISENPLTQLKDLIDYLIKIKQIQRAAEGYLEIRKKNLAQMIDQVINQSGKLEGDSMKQLTDEYAKFVLRVNDEFRHYFLFDNKNLFLKSFISNWINQSCSVFFCCIQQNVFWGSELEEILENIKIISDTLYEHETKNISLNFIIQRLFIDELEFKMNEMFAAYDQRLVRMQNIDDWKVYPMFTVLNVNFCEEEIGNPNLQAVQFISEIDLPEVKKQIFQSSKPVQDLPKDTLKEGYQKYLVETNLKGARHAILFWNTIFQLIDKVISNVNIESRRIFSSQLISLVESKIQRFISEYINSFNEVLTNVSSFSEIQLLAACANINTCLQFTKFAQKYEAIKLAPHIKLDNKDWIGEWKKHVNKVYNSCYDLIFSYFKFKLLLHIPRFFSEYRKVYTAPIDVQLGKEASPLFVKIAYLLENIKDNLSLIMSKNDIISYMQKLMEAINYMIEYIIYWEFHWVQRGKEVFFLKEIDIARMGLGPYMDQINVYLSQNAVKIHYFNENSMRQFIFDMHFLAALYNNNLCKEAKDKAKVNNDQFLLKVLSCYCSIKKLDIKQFPYKFQDHSKSLMEYCMNKYSQNISAMITRERDQVLKASQVKSQQQSMISVNQSSSSSNNNTASFASSAGRKSIKERIFAINLTMQKNF